MHDQTNTPGLLRFMLGLVLVFGAAGGLDDPTAPVFTLLAIAVVGIALMYWATVAMNRHADRIVDNIGTQLRNSTQNPK